MNYEKQTWERGETISADKLNHIEEGVEQVSQNGGGMLVVKPTGRTTQNGDYELIWQDKTWQEVDDALANGMMVILPSKVTANGGHEVVFINMTNVFTSAPTHRIDTSLGSGGSNPPTYYADSADGYLYTKKLSGGIS